MNLLRIGWKNVAARMNIVFASDPPLCASSLHFHVAKWFNYDPPWCSLAMIAHLKCHGTTRAGHGCQLTAASAMVDGSGRSVAAPLRRGSPLCLFHARPFSTTPARVTGPLVVLYLDLGVNLLATFLF